MALGAGDGTLAAAQYNAPKTSGDYSCYTAVTGDFNGDGRTDLAWVHQWNGGLRAQVALSNANGTFATAQASTPRSSGDFTAWRPHAGDFDGDGEADLAWTSAGASGLHARIALSNGDGTLAAAQASAPASAGDFTGATSFAGDFDGDGRSDVAWAHEPAEGLRAYVALSNGDGTLADARYNAPRTSASLASFTPRVGDFNGDGRAELVWTYQSGEGLRAEAALARAPPAPRAPWPPPPPPSSRTPSTTRWGG